MLFLVSCASGDLHLHLFGFSMPRVLNGMWHCDACTAIARVFCKMGARLCLVCPIRVARLLERPSRSVAPGCQPHVWPRSLCFLWGGAGFGAVCTSRLMLRWIHCAARLVQAFSCIARHAPWLLAAPRADIGVKWMRFWILYEGLKLSMFWRRW